MKFVSTIVSTILVILLTQVVATAQMYQYRDSNGRIIYSNTPPDNAEETRTINNDSSANSNKSDWNRFFIDKVDDFDGERSAFILPWREIIVHQKYGTTVWSTPIAGFDKENKLKTLSLHFTINAKDWYFINKDDLELKIDGQHFFLKCFSTDTEVGTLLGGRGITEEIGYALDRNIFNKIINAEDVQFRMQGKRVNITSSIPQAVIDRWKQFNNEVFKE